MDDVAEMEDILVVANAAEIQSTTCESSAEDCRMEQVRPSSHLPNDLCLEERVERDIGVQQIAVEIAKICTALGLGEARLVQCCDVMAAEVAVLAVLAACLFRPRL